MASQKLAEAKAFYEQEQVAEAKSAAEEALSGLKSDGDAVGAAGAMRLSLVCKVACGEMKASKAIDACKDELNKGGGKVFQGLMNFAIAELQLLSAEPDKALKAVAEAQSCFDKADDKLLESEVLCKVKVNAYIAQGLGGRAVTAANLALQLAQKVGDKKAEANAWFALTVARFADANDDAMEAAEKTLGIFQDLGDKSKKAAALYVKAQGQLAMGDPSSALMTARESLEAAKACDCGPLIASAVEVLVEARIANENAKEALEVAKSELAGLLRGKGKEVSTAGTGIIATAMGAVVVAEAACNGVDAAVVQVKDFIEDRRKEGDKKGEVAMLHRWASMTPFPDIAMNTALVAKKLAEEIDDAQQVLTINKSITELWVAKGKPEKAPTRKQALMYLKELAVELEKEDGEKFEDAMKKLLPYFNAISEGDLEAILYKVVLKDEKLYGDFLEEHGFWPKKESKVSVSKFGTGTPNMAMQTVPMAWHYMNFRWGGLGYGPRYRCCAHPIRDKNEPGNCQSMVELQDCHDDWERELQYNPSILDCGLQAGAAAGAVFPGM